jgi:hypothetical protein
MSQLIWRLLTKKRRSSTSQGIPRGKENLLWVQHFATIEELRLALIAFKQTYNQTWIIERHGYRTPAQVRADQLGRMPMAA